MVACTWAITVRASNNRRAFHGTIEVLLIEKLRKLVDHAKSLSETDKIMRFSHDSFSIYNYGIYIDLQRSSDCHILLRKNY